MGSNRAVARGYRRASRVVAPVLVPVLFCLMLLAPGRAMAVGMELRSLSWEDGFDRSVRDTEVLEGELVKPMLGPDTEQAMLEAIARYQIFARRGGWPEIPGGHTMVVGIKDDRVPLLVHRLMIGGDLVPAPGFDETVYDEAVQAAVIRFQQRHGILAHGKVDEKTRKALNVPAADRLRTLEANLERVRKAVPGLRGRYVVVNVPAAELEAVEDGYLYSRHVTVVGKVDRPTPVVVSQIVELNFNPYWHAPISIAEKDIIPQLRRGLSYLEKINVKVFEGGYYGEEVDPRTVDWSTASAERYFFRQEPGESNAMATVRINFPNEHHVYLHDTPGKGLFNQAVRYDSSGCIRVDQVQTFVSWLLRGQEDWSAERVGEVAESHERLDVELVRKVPLRVVYLTAWALADGSVHFRPDIYGRDDPSAAVFDAPEDDAAAQPVVEVNLPTRMPQPNPMRARGVTRQDDHGRQHIGRFGDSVFEEMR